LLGVIPIAKGKPVVWSRWDSAICILLALTTIGIHLPLLRVANGLMDEGIYLVYPQLLSRGWLLHRDFQNAYGPGEFRMLQGWFAITGPSVSSERLFAFAIRAGLVVGVFLLLRTRGRFAAICGAAASILFVLVMPPRAASWVTAVTFLIFSLAFALRDNPTKLSALIAGVLAGIAMTIRLDTIALAYIVAFPLLLLHLRRTKAIFYVIGVLLGFAPFIAHVYFAGPAVVYDNMFVDPVLRAGPGRHLPLPPSAPDDYRRFIILLVWLAGSTAAMVAMRPWRSIRIAAPALAVWTTSLCLLPYVLQRADRNHFAQGLAVIVPLSLYVLFAVPWRFRWIKPIIAIAAPWLAVLAMYDRLWGPADSYATMALGPSQTVEFAHAHRRLPIWASELPDYTTLFAAIDRIKDAKSVYVAPSNLRFTPYNDTQLYFLMPELTPSGYYFEMNPGTTNREGSRLAADIAGADLLILGTRYEGWWEPNASTQPGSTAAEEVVARDFTLDTDAGIFRLYVNRKLQHRDLR
jgi:hypothetical protein